MGVFHFQNNYAKTVGESCQLDHPDAALAWRPNFRLYRGQSHSPDASLFLSRDVPVRVRPLASALFNGGVGSKWAPRRDNARRRLPDDTVRVDSAGEINTAPPPRSPGGTAPATTDAIGGRSLVPSAVSRVPIRGGVCHLRTWT